VVLAAGAGRRFGGSKLLARLDGRTLIQWAVANALDTPIDHCFVVIGSDGSAVETSARLGVPDDPRLRFIVANDAAEGLSASLNAGIRALPEDSLGALIFLGDMPQVHPRHGIALARVLRAGAPCAEIIYCGRPAHPVAISANLYPVLLSLEGDSGARRILDRHGAIRLFTNDVGTVVDIDVPADLDRLRAELPFRLTKFNGENA